eukprot:6385995-Lingulodinium_polyedra.AAC.1
MATRAARASCACASCRNDAPEMRPRGCATGICNRTTVKSQLRCIAACMHDHANRIRRVRAR